MIDGALPRVKLPLFLILFWLFFAISASQSPFKELSRAQVLLFLNASIFFIIVKGLPEESRFSLKKILCVVLTLFLLFYVPATFMETMSSTKDQLFLKPNFVSSIALVTLFLGKDLYSKIKPLSVVAILMATLALFLSKSLAATLGLIFSLVWMGRGKFRNLLPKTKGSWAIVLLLLLLLMICLNSWRVKSFDHRMGWWSMAAKSVQQHPFLGSGPGSFEKISMGWYKEGELRTPFVHNFPLQMASECGILTPLFLTLFILRGILKSDKSSMGGALLALFIQNLFDYPLNIAGLLLILFILLALAEKPQPISLKKEELKKRIIIFVLLSLCILGSVWRFSIRSLLAFQKTLQAQEDFKNGNRSSAELNLRKAMAWDKLALDPILNLSELLRARGEEKEVDSLDKKALMIDPTSLKYRTRALH